MLRLRTLGGLSLERDGGPPLGGAAAQRRRLTLLAILGAAGGRGVSRDRLIGLLWPEMDEARARSALSQALYALRHATGEEHLVEGYDTLRLDPEIVTCDVTELEDALAADDLAHAANLYTGPFLDGVHVGGAPEFEHWLDGVRLHLGQAVERALERLAVEAEQRGEYGQAADWWRRLVAIDPLKTRAVLGLMGALARGGDRAAALRQAERYADVARDELEAEPSAAVVAYAATLRGEADQRFAERYVIERELGRGGMAVVYLARDTRHERPVALKMLRPDIGAALGRERLEREIRVTARLQHPHILPLHDSGEWGEQIYYVMPYVEGESLRQRLNRERQLSLGDAIAIGAEIAEALDHAHRRGVVHQDVKPENVLLAEGHAIVADFGIARIVSGAALDAALAKPGVTLGTVAYMAPEQIGGAEIGPACDVFGLGCVLFEMIAGRPPWIAVSMDAMMARRRGEPAPSLRRLRPETPPWLDELLRRMLASDPSRRPSSAADVAQLLASGGGSPLTGLPASPDETIGREDEVRAGCSLLGRDDVAVLTLTGTGGAGKTRLAIQIAREVEAQFERVVFVDLSAIREPSSALPAIAAAAGVQPQGGRDLLDAAAAALAGRRMLIVLDNFEQVVGAAPVIARLVAAAPMLKLLVTSRMRLGIRAEHEFFVAPLSLPAAGADPSVLRDNPAVRLFVRRATEANASLVFGDDELRAAARICARLDGLPLAIELAAARCRLMSPQTLATRLDAGFGLLSGGGRDRPERHQTLRQAVAWSIALLSPDERRVFTRMTVFAGGCTLGAAEAVCGAGLPAPGVLDAVSTLVDASLLMRDLPPRGGEPRLRMLETVREIAREAFAGDPESGTVSDRHARWYRGLAAALSPALTGEAQNEALGALAAEHANLGAALEHVITGGDAGEALTLGAALWRYWLVRGHLSEGRAWLARILALPGQDDPAVDGLRADAMTGAGHIAQNTGAVDEAAALFEAVLEIRRRLGDHSGLARALADLGWIAWRRCDFAAARRLSTECLSLAERIGATRAAALALTNLGATALFEGRFGEACAAFERSAQLRERVADQRGVAFANTFLAWSMCRDGRLERARELLDGAESTLTALGDERLIYLARDVRAEVHLRDGDPAAAAEILRIDSILGVRRFGDRWSVAHGLALASWASRLLGRIDQAVACAQESLELRRAEGDRYGEAECLALLAAAARERGNDATGIELLQRSRAIRQAIGDAAGLAECDAELQQLAPSA